MPRYLDFVDGDDGSRALNKLDRWKENQPTMQVLREHFAMTTLPSGSFRLAVLLVYRFPDDPPEYQPEKRGGG